MKSEISRDVALDLWSLCQSGEASNDSRALVDAFLEEDVLLASRLEASAGRDTVMPAVRLSPDAERQLLDAARGRARMKLLVIGGAIALAAFVALVALGGLIFLILTRSL